MTSVHKDGDVSSDLLLCPATKDDCATPLAGACSHLRNTLGDLWDLVREEIIEIHGEIVVLVNVTSRCSEVAVMIQKQTHTWLCLRHRRRGSQHRTHTKNAEYATQQQQLVVPNWRHVSFSTVVMPRNGSGSACS